MIYFIQPKAGGPVKIGTTIRLTQRLAQLQAETRMKLRVLAVIDGGRIEERELHSQFSHLRQVGEWFEPKDDLLGFIVQKGREWDGSDEVPKEKRCQLIVDSTRELRFALQLRAARERCTTSELVNIILRRKLAAELEELATLR